MIILNDRTPVQGHDPGLIVSQLKELASLLQPACFLLDLQRPGNPETAAIAEAVVRELSCPVGVTEAYAQGLDCPVFLAPPPLDRPLGDYLEPWKHREVWLETALNGLSITVTEAGTQYEDCSFAEATEHSFAEDSLLCHYHITVSDTQARFHLYRTGSDLTALLQAAEVLGVTRAVGLYQELGKITPIQ